MTTDEENDERTTYAAELEDDAPETARIAEPEEIEEARSADPGHGHGHDDHGHGHGHGGQGAALRQLTIVAMLIVAMIVLHEFAVPVEERTIDPTAMLALGFVVLACFTIGALFDVVKLPHITGYLVAGIVFGPSIAGFIPFSLWPPFDEGVLNPRVIEQLNPLNTLAVALIALTAGGELRVDALKKGLRAISGVLVGQLITVLILTTAFFWAVSGAIPVLTLPGLGDVSAAWLPIGLTVGAISFATSPAATVAIINETGAKGSMASTVMSTVVLKDVFVVLLFGVFSALASQAMGAESEGSLAVQLSIEIGGSIFAGVVLGGVMALYLRFVDRELMLFVAGIVYITTLISAELHLDAVLVFLTAGFLVVNFEKRGEKLIHSVEQLSMPVFVVFFTLAGAKLHLDEVGHLAAFAIALVLVRVFAVYIGVRMGAALGRADEGTKRYGWMGFLSQAGVAITFANFMGSDRFPEEVHALSGLLIAAVAINEVIGPVLLKVGLSLAGEVGDAKKAEAEEEVDAEVVAFAEWPARIRSVDWGGELEASSPQADRALHELESELRDIVGEVADGPMAAFHQRAESYLRDLRREFLRHHRRLLVQARASGDGADGTESEAGAAFAAMLRQEQAELAERWRTIVLTRSAQLRQRALWHPSDVVEKIDASVLALPERLKLPYAESSFRGQKTDSVPTRLRRLGLRFRRAIRRPFGRTLERDVPFRDLVRYHLSGVAPVELESTAAVLVDAERHLSGRTRNLFDGIVYAYDELALAAVDPSVNLEARTLALRDDVEEGLMLALDEVRRMADDGAYRTGRTLAAAMRTIKVELPRIATLDLSARQRQSSNVFAGRVRALQQLGERVDELRQSCGGEFSLLAMELELVGLEARLKDVVATHEARLRSELTRRVVQQAERVDTALGNALTSLGETLAGGDRKTGAQLEEALRGLTAPVEKAAGDAARIVREMRDELLDEDKFADLVKAMRDTSDLLTTHYEVIAGRMMRGDERLPATVPTVEVPFRELVTDYTETTVLPELMRTGRSAADALQPLALALKETERAVAFVNVDVVSVDLEAFRDETVPSSTISLLEEVFIGQLQLVETTLHSLTESASEWPALFGTEVRRAVLGALDELRGQLADGKVTEAKLAAIRKTATRRRLAQQARELPDVLRDGTKQLKDTFVSLIGANRLASWRRALGLRDELVTTDLQSEAFAEPTPSVALPIVYRRLFAADTTEARDVLTGRDELIARAKTVLQAKRSTRRAVALVGPDGVGKASVGSAIVRGSRWKSVLRVSLTEPQSIADVHALLERARKAQLVVVDGVHWMMSAGPGGFEPLREFALGVLDDGGQRAWMIHSDDLLWTYASAVSPLEDAFPEVVRLEPLTVEELKSAVMDRHRRSSYGHAFEEASDLWLRGFASMFKKPFERYFADLHAASGGLVRDALRLWLASIQSIEDDDIIRVGTVPPSTYPAARALPEADLHTLFLIARQGWMDPQVLAGLRRTDEAEAKAELGRLHYLGVLEAHGRAFRIASHLRGVIGRVLKGRGWT